MNILKNEAINNFDKIQKKKEKIVTAVGGELFL